MAALAWAGELTFYRRTFIIGLMFGFLSNGKKDKRIHKNLTKKNERIEQLKAQLSSAKVARDKARQKLLDVSGQLAEERFLRGNAEARLARMETDLIVAEENPLPANLPWPLPPLYLRARVASYWAGHTFLEKARTLSEDLTRVLDASGEDLSRFRHVLDWGCGCGRVLRRMPGLFPNARFTGVDIDMEAIAWNREHLHSLAEFHTVPDHPPSALPSHCFDFILGLSVFTHLPLELEKAWLRELARVAAPEALLLLTYHGEELLTEHFTPDQSLENDDGFSYFRTSPTLGLPDYYQSSFHSETALHRLWGAHFDILSIHPRSINQRQGAVLCRPKG